MMEYSLVVVNDTECNYHRILQKSLDETFLSYFSLPGSSFIAQSCTQFINSKVEEKNILERPKDKKPPSVCLDWQGLCLTVKEIIYFLPVVPYPELIVSQKCRHQQNSTELFSRTEEGTVEIVVKIGIQQQKGRQDPDTFVTRDGVTSDD